MTAHDAFAERGERRIRLLVAAAGVGLVLVQVVLILVRNPRLLGAIFFNFVPGRAIANPVPWVALGLCLALLLGSALLLVLRRDAGALVLAVLLLVTGLWGTVLNGSPLWLWLAGPVCLAAGALVLAGRSGTGRMGPAEVRCPACGTVQTGAAQFGAGGEAGPSGENGRCELCGFELPAAGAVTAAPAAGRGWGHVSVAVFFATLGLVIVWAVMAARWSSTRQGQYAHLEGLVVFVLGALAIGVMGFTFGAAAGLVGWVRSRQGGVETSGWGVAGSILNLTPVLVSLAFVVWPQLMSSVGRFGRSAGVPFFAPAPVPPAAPSMAPRPMPPRIPPPPLTGEAVAARLAQAGDLVGQRRYAEADAMLTEPWQYLEARAPGEDSTWTARLLLAEARLAQRNYTPAERVLRPAYLELRAVGGPLPPLWEARRAVVLEQLAEVCQETGRAEEAARLRAERGRPTWELAPPPREVP